jgi:2Fe-2S ferredoxin
MNITFILKDQEEKTVDFSKGQTILQVAEEHDIKINQYCEGNCICGACHVIVENLNDKLQPISDAENDALDNASGVTMKSRLACQIVLDESLNGLRVKINQS